MSFIGSGLDGRGAMVVVSCGWWLRGCNSVYPDGYSWKSFIRVHLVVLMLLGLGLMKTSGVME
jgi:hypothetical protein